ncbi:asparagine--tRNA ligase [Buchnera aphidicola]|uniref:asparagine--tRNA ligase n=1 Tax=Buchnera aphidicola TaxID=9 RepID=UPI003463AC15
MKIASVLEILQDNIMINSTITIFGWIKNRRDSKSGFSFLTINDGSSLYTIQIIAINTLSNYYKEILHLTVGCSVQITGILVLSIGKKQKYEIKAKKIIILGWIENPNNYPMSAKKHSIEYLREFAHLRSRTNLIGVISRIRNTLFQVIHKFLSENGYLWIPTPIITGLNTEGAGEMFRVSTLNIDDINNNKNDTIDYKKDFFGKESFLTVSGQLTLEAYACSLSKVYNFGPTFRAENSNTSRHLAEFWMLEVESAFMTLNEIANFAEKMLKYICEYLLQHATSDINFLKNNIDFNIISRLESFLHMNFIRLEYKDAVSILLNSKKLFNEPVFFGMDMSSEHERYLVEKHFKIPVIILNYPKKLKAFYMRLNDDQETVSAMDILVPGIGELIGGSQREDRISILDQRILEAGLNKKDYWWYRDLRRYGSVPHSGFGMGFERLISYFTGISNVRDVIPFPRTVRNADF